MATILLLLISALAILPLKERTLQNIHMIVLNEETQEIDYGENAIYEIGVKNTGEKDIGMVELELTNIPEYWNAELSDRVFSLSSNSRKVITLTVYAPSPEEAVKNDEISQIAYIGVRGGNDTIGTVTVIKGYMQVKRNGTIVETVEIGDNSYEIELNDTLLVKKNAGENIGKIQIDLTQGINSLYCNYTGKNWTGNNITAKYQTSRKDDGEITFTRSSDKSALYISFNSGNLKVEVDKKKTDGNRSGSSEKWGKWIFNIGRNQSLDTTSSELDYNAVLIFSLSPTIVSIENSLFSVNMNSEIGVAEAMVYEGSMVVQNEAGSNLLLNEYQTVSSTPTDKLPEEPSLVQATIVEIETGMTSENTMEVDGQNIWDVEDPHIINSVGGKPFYIIPFEGADTRDITVTHKGNTNGKYRMKFTMRYTKLIKSFEINSTFSLNSNDIITVGKNSITMNIDEKGKTYDLIITYQENGDEKSTFIVTEVETSKELQTVDIKDWAILSDNEAESVWFKEGNTPIILKNHDTGKMIKEKLRKEEDESKTNIWLWAFFISIILLSIFACIGYYYSRSAKNDNENLEVYKININPKKSEIGKSTKITAIIKNNGISINKSIEKRIDVSFYVNYERIGEKSIDISRAKFKSGKRRHVSIEWTPSSLGKNEVKVAVDVDDDEHDIGERTIEALGSPAE